MYILCALYFKTIVYMVVIKTKTRELRQQCVETILIDTDALVSEIISGESLE